MMKSFPVLAVAMTLSGCLIAPTTDSGHQTHCTYSVDVDQTRIDAITERSARHFAKNHQLIIDYQSRQWPADHSHLREPEPGCTKTVVFVRFEPTLALLAGGTSGTTAWIHCNPLTTILALRSPTSVLIHETYHLEGEGHFGRRMPGQ